MPSQNKYTITLLITEASTLAAVPTLRVEAWDKDMIFDDLVGSAVTGADGTAVFTFAEDFFAEKFYDRQPDLYFKIFHDNKLIFSTEDSVIWNINHGKSIINISLPAGALHAKGKKASPSSPSISPLRTLTETPGGYTVSGYVVTPDGEPVSGQQLYAVDVDLKGAASYKTVTKKSGLAIGFDYLGIATSDATGFYTITFNSGAYEGKSERIKADVVVYALDSSDNITGSSILVNATNYNDRNEVHDLTVLLKLGDTRTEYAKLMEKLNKFLEDSGVSLLDLAKSDDQVNFTASELEENVVKIRIAVDAAVLNSLIPNTKDSYHELLYGIGRQLIQLSWLSLYRKKDTELTAAINQSASENIIQSFTAIITAFLNALHAMVVKQVLHYAGTAGGATLDELLTNATNDATLREAFVDALRKFDGDDYNTFWTTYLNKTYSFPQPLIDSLLLTQQLTMLSGSYNPLISHLQVGTAKDPGIKSIAQVLSYTPKDWDTIIGTTGVPAFVNDASEYAKQIQSTLHAAFPTQKISLMVKSAELPVVNDAVKDDLHKFITGPAGFDFATSPFHTFEKIIDSTCTYPEQVKTELKSIQRILQVSTSPKVMAVLKANNLNSAYSITTIPKNIFISTYGALMDGGDAEAAAVYERASFLSARSGGFAMKMMEASHAVAPALVLSDSDRDAAIKTIQTQIPNYSQLFGSPDMCECAECRSVYSASAYFVELLRFLDSGKKNIYTQTPLEMFAKRRPDLLYLPLTCENTNTVIPYIDLANEVMEYYTAYKRLDEKAAHDTGSTTAEELRAYPQNFVPAAYKIIKDAVYPFTLPYHQPLDVIRTYSNYLSTSRYDVMKALLKTTAPLNETKAVEAESLGISEEEFIALTGADFSAAADTKALNEYFGYKTIFEVEQMSGTGMADGIHEFLRRSGLKYTELVELLETTFINPYQNTVGYLENLFANCTLNASQLYNEFISIKGGGEPPFEIAAVLSNAGISTIEFSTWLTNNLDGFNSVITLYQSRSMCDLDTTLLRTIANVYTDPGMSGISNTSWSKIHRFIRLYRKLGWTIHETDLVLNALGQKDITAGTITKLSAVLSLANKLNIPFNQLAVLWGNIDVYGAKSLYTKLFLNKAVQRVDESFSPDKFGHYLTDTTRKLKDHIPGILAALRLSQEDLQAILNSATVIENNKARKLDITKDVLNLANLSTIYRYVVLSKALSLKINDCCQLITTFGTSPFSNWDVTNQTFINISPGSTLDFCNTVSAVKASGFKPGVLQYIFSGVLPADTAPGIDTGKVKQAAADVHASFAAISQTYPDTPVSPLNIDIIRNSLSISFDADTVSQFTSILQSQQIFTINAGIITGIVIPDGLKSKYSYNSVSGIITCHGIVTEDERAILKGLSATTDDFKAAIDALYITTADYIKASNSFSVLVDTKPDILIPAWLSPKYTYIKNSGRLICKGVISDVEKAALVSLDKLPNTPFANAVNALYSAPGQFINSNFGGIFNAAADLAVLLNHPAQPAEAGIDAKLALVYTRLVPWLRQKLRSDSVIQHIATLVGLSEAATKILVQSNLATLTGSLTQQGISAEFFKDGARTVSVLKTTNDTVDFDWAAHSDILSARWGTYFTPPSSGDYTFVVSVKDAGEAFNLYLDDALVLSKTTTDTTTTGEFTKSLNASVICKLTLEYARTTGNAGISLSLKTATTPEAIISPSLLLPVENINSFAQTVTLYYRAAKFISGFKLNEIELAHLAAHPANFAGINFTALTATHWACISSYVQLRDAIPQNQATLIDVFVAAQSITPAPATTPDALINLVCLATGWDKNTLAYFANSYFKFTVNDFINEAALIKLNTALQLAAKTGVAAETLATWAGTKADFDTLDNTAQLVKSILKAKYEEEDWLTISGGLSDKIRENQKQALISYLLTRDELQKWGATDADGLFEYFLIDVQMGACMDTSRIVQANSSVQMFISRIMLNLESNTAGDGKEKGVAPNAIDTERWLWMKQYRVWEANRKVFLYPENWLEPEWRDDRSPFFKELESELVQNDITTDSVETGFRNYLSKLNDIANLDVCGVYQEKDGDGKVILLHVVARNHNAPYHFYYRTWDKLMTWSAWEKMPVDIRSIEAGDASGAHVMPVVWKKRTFIFWPEFTEKQRDLPLKNDYNQDATTEDLSTQPVTKFKPVRYVEVRLAWTERKNDKWAPKQVTKEFIEIDCKRVREFNTYGVFPASVTDPYNHITFKSEIQPDGLVIRAYTNDAYIFSFKHDFFEWGYFKFADIQSKPYTYSGIVKTPVAYPSGNSYSNNFQKHTSGWSLAYSGNTYISGPGEHNVIFSNNILEKEAGLKDPFFYQDAARTYFVHPFDAGVINQVKNPSAFPPPVVNTVNDSFYTSGQKALMPFAPLVSQPVVAPVKPVHGGNMLTRVQKTKAAAFAAPATLVKAAADTNAAAAPSAFVNNALSGTDPYSSWFYNNPAAVVGFEFHTFNHPYSSQYVTNLNLNGVKGLLESDTSIKGDKGANFVTGYHPNFAQGFVKQAPANENYTPSLAYTYYKDNVCFDLYGANSIYNWELFFHAPLYIANRLSKNGKYEEAMHWFHYIFDPTTDAAPVAGQSETSRYWKVLPFQYTPKDNLESWFRSLSDKSDHTSDNQVISAWRDNPFKPHLIARNRPSAYMKNVVLKYVENLIAWADSLFRADTMETVNEALQIYVIANHILGPRPQYVPKRGDVKAQTYASMQGKWDGFSNALVEMENIFPYTSGVAVGDKGSGVSLLGIGAALYFCIPGNEQLLGYWDTVADRLFKIRHCLNIDGVESKLSLFAPPIDPGMLINASAQGLSLGSILADLSSPPPIYRFSYMLQRANDFCAEVKSLGSSLLSALEKKDGEELGRMRATHETQMLELMQGIKERQVLEARTNRDGLLKTRETAKFRLGHYTALLDDTSITVPEVPSIDADLNADSSLPGDTSITELKLTVDDKLSASEERGVKLIPREKEDLDKALAATIFQEYASSLEAASGIAHFFPSATIAGAPFGIGGDVSFGGPNIGSAISAAAKVPQIMGSILSFQAGQASKMATYIRREQEWALQANLAAKEIIQLDKQITSANIRVQIAEKELENHKIQVENTKQVEQFLYNKFTGLELYQWMKEQLFAVYRQSYNMAYDLAKKAESCYRYEIGSEITSFIQYGYWDNTQQGLCSGEKLHLALRQLEKSHLEVNKRELELTKNISVGLLNPLALQQLKTSGKCSISIPEELFDLDYQGHYFRRVKSVSLSIPCIAGPYTTVGCTLRLVKNSIRVNTKMNSSGGYEHENDEGIWIDDDRFRSNNVPVKAIATSSAQRDNGMFEFSFRDERYLPFEGSGAISEWKIELTGDKNLRQFDYSTLSDVIMHVSYTAREDEGLFKDAAVTNLNNFLKNTGSLMRMFSMKHDFSTEWHKFFYPPAAVTNQKIDLVLSRDNFPFFINGRALTITKIDVLAQTVAKGSYKLVLFADNATKKTDELTMIENAVYGNMNTVSVTAFNDGSAVSDINVFSAISLQINHYPATGGAKVSLAPGDLTDVALVVHYTLV